MKMDKVRMIAIENGHRAQKCSGFSRMVVTVPRVEVAGCADTGVYKRRFAGFA